MILVRLRHNHRPEIVFNGDEKDIIHKIHELNLCDYHDAYFYESGKFENLGLGGDEYDYYSIYEDEVEMNNVLGGSRAITYRCCYAPFINYKT